MMMQRRTLLLCITVIALVAGGCVSGTQQSTNGGARKPKGPNEPVRIGFSMDTLKEERWQRDKDLVEKRCKEIGAELNVQVANGSDSEQIKQAENMLTQGIDVLIVAPHNGEIAASIVEAAHKQGVAVISYDRLIKNSDVDLYISHQVVKMGEMQAQYLLDHVNKKPANFVVVGGSPTDNNALLLHQGQMNVLQPAVARGDVKIVADEYAKEWQASAALNIVENALTRANNQIDAVVASNDGTARGAVQALEGQHLAGKVLVSGQDADLASLKLIVEGKQTMTIYKSIQPLAAGAVDAAVKLARGEKVATTETIDNGFKKVPAILLEPVAVDRNNLLATVVKDGYHTLAEICAGLPPEKCPKE
jgi:D-xylose transport system substrate-binding protein